MCTPSVSCFLQIQSIDTKKLFRFLTEIAIGIQIVIECVGLRE